MKRLGEGALGGRLNSASLLSMVSGAIAVASLIVGSYQAAPPYVVGENLVLTEIEVLPGLYMKPITLFTYAFFVAFAAGLYTPNTRRRARALPPNVRALVYLFVWFLALASGFEIVYHMVLWSAALAFQGLKNPDIIINPWPKNYPINVVFSTKLVVLIFACSLFTIDYLKRVEREA
ncbi:TPA: hypothetical protein EYP26_03875 [Candidatus Bathyarchaeota archaeon]|nr:hypothetical protein [Candidatus Bathyarchaeota archaeon]